MDDLIRRQAADLIQIDRQFVLRAINIGLSTYHTADVEQELEGMAMAVEELPAVQPQRKWMPCSNPPKHHKDVIVRGIEAIGNVTVHKVMQWDVDTWRPTDYAPSVTWKEWSEI